MIMDAHNHRTWTEVPNTSRGSITAVAQQSEITVETQHDIAESIRDIMKNLRMAQCGHISEYLDKELAILESTNASLDSFITLRRRALQALMDVEY